MYLAQALSKRAEIIKQMQRIESTLGSTAYVAEEDRETGVANATSNVLLYESLMQKLVDLTDAIDFTNRNATIEWRGAIMSLHKARYVRDVNVKAAQMYDNLPSKPITASSTKTLVNVLSSVASLVERANTHRRAARELDDLLQHANWIVEIPVLPWMANHQ